MFIGHWAPAFAAAAASKRAPKLGTLFLAAQLVDWAFYVFVLVGIENFHVEPGFTVMKPFFFDDYPFTHSLVGSAAWAVGFGLIVGIAGRSIIAGVLAGLVVASHWVLDLISHGPDLTFAGGENRFGFGLWNYPTAAIIVELALTLGAFVYYVRRTRGPVMPPLILIAVMLGLQVLNWLGSDPESVTVPLVLTALVAYAVVTLLAAWVGSTRWHKREVGLAVGT